MISVVLPSYNRGALLARAIDSVLAQGAQAGQVIVVDDGSTDNTKDVCAQYANRIDYVWQKNAGPSLARNIGVKHARNQWVAFLDSDDYWTPFHLARMAKAIEKTDGEARFYFSDMQIEGGYNDSTLWQTINFVPPHPVHLTKDGTNWAFLTRQPMMLQCSVFRKDVWMESGGLDPRFHVMEDTDLFFRLSVGGKICAVSGVGCVQTDDDISDGRLTRQTHSGKIVYWNQAIAVSRRLVRELPNLSPRYRRVARRRLASAYWRVARHYWLRGDLGRTAWHLPMIGWADPFFALSLVAYRRADVNRVIVLPEYD